MQRPGLRSDEAREREDYIDRAKFHRAHVMEISYFCVLVAVALLIISFFVSPDWAWFLRGGIAGLILTFLYVWGRVAFDVWRRVAHRSFS
jgi:1,4-dihydroxy-2-naphthoate octaprenyltransferase